MAKRLTQPAGHPTDARCALPPHPNPGAHQPQVHRGQKVAPRLGQLPQRGLRLAVHGSQLSQGAVGPRHAGHLRYEGGGSQLVGACTKSAGSGRARGLRRMLGGVPAGASRIQCLPAQLLHFLQPPILAIARSSSHLRDVREHEAEAEHACHNMSRKLVDVSKHAAAHAQTCIDCMGGVACGRRPWGKR